jgi:hypothetical protein
MDGASPYSRQNANAAYGVQSAFGQTTTNGLSLVGPTMEQFLQDIISQPALITDGTFDADPTWTPNEDGSFG